MTAAPDPSPPAQPETRVTTTPARQPLIGSATWRASAREFVIIVAGVLAALGAQALWEQRGEREIERAYLSQLLVDAQENRSRLAEALDEDEQSRHALQRMLQTVSSSAAVESDSLMYWISYMGRASDFKPVTGTHRALLGTGELRYIRDDSVRAAVMRYAAQMDGEVERLEQLRGVTLATIGPAVRALPFMQHMFAGNLQPEQVDLPRLRRDPDAAAVLFTLQAAHINRINGLRRVAEATDELIAVLQRRRPQN